MENYPKIQKLTIQKILSDENLRQSEFPVAQKKIFLAHAGVCPLPSRVAAAITRYLNCAQTDDQEESFKLHSLYEIRKSAALILNARPEEIALVGSTSVALSIIAAGVQLNRGDNILIYHDDYPSNVYPWENLKEKGVVVNRLKTAETGKITLQDVLNQIDEKTRLVALSSCHFLSGWRLEIGKIGQELRNRGILFCVDGIQTVGAFPTSIEHVDFLAADAHKWLLGPCGAGILYIRKQLQESIRPVLLGWHNVRCPGFVAQDEIIFPDDARKFEAGTHPLILLAGLKASLDIINEIGIENISSELLRKRRIIVEALRNLNCDILHPNSGLENQSAIISFTIPGMNMAVIHKALAEANIITSLRQDRSGRKFIRVSPHFYNTDKELNTFAEVLYSILKKGNYSF